MTIKQEPWTRYHEKKKADTFTIRLNIEERKRLEENKRILRQPKDSTALKQLAEIGEIVLHDPSFVKALGVVFLNKRRNERTGIYDFD